MKHSIYLLAVTCLLLASCNKPFKKAEGGLQYKIISDGKGKTLKNGDFFEIQIDQHYKGTGKDTLLFDSKTVGNQIVPMDSASIPPVYFKIFKEARKGDSIIVKQLTDSLMKNGGNTPPFMKKGAYLIFNYKIVNVFETKESADSANRAQLEIARGKDSVKAIEQLKKDDKTITEYLAKNNIKAVKAPQGTYVEIISQGTGPLIDTSVSVQVFYRGKTLAGKEFDSNMDTTSGQPKTPLLIAMVQDPSRGLTVIKGWTDGLTLLSKGAKAKFYIPSTLAYGPQAQGPDLGANEILVFDIEVADLLNRDKAVIENEKARKIMMAQREAMMQAQQQAQGQQRPQPGN
jgi:FKBP-type peptidyl-prolyl cis-trans isomerase FkpA